MYVSLFGLRFENGKSDKEILDNLVDPNRYDKRLLPPVDGERYIILFFYKLIKCK